MRRVSVGSSSMTAARAGASQRGGCSRAGEDDRASTCAQGHTIKRPDSRFTRTRVPSCLQRERGRREGKREVGGRLDGRSSEASMSCCARAGPLVRPLDPPLPLLTRPSCALPYLDATAISQTLSLATPPSPPAPSLVDLSAARLVCLPPLVLSTLPSDPTTTPACPTSFVAKSRMENPRLSLELNELHHPHSSLEVSPRLASPSPDRLSLNPGSQLHPVDRGRDAWLFLAA